VFLLLFAPDPRKRAVTLGMPCSPGRIGRVFKRQYRLRVKAHWPSCNRAHHDMHVRASDQRCFNAQKTAWRACPPAHLLCGHRPPPETPPRRYVCDRSESHGRLAARNDAAATRHIRPCWQTLTQRAASDAPRQSAQTRFVAASCCRDYPPDCAATPRDGDDEATTMLMRSPGWRHGAPTTKARIRLDGQIL